MQKVILDTNVLVSALISNSIPTLILFELVLKQKIEPCLSPEIFEEYVEVLGREKFKKFSRFKTNSEIILSKIMEISTFYHPQIKLEIISDPSDNKFLELAATCNADFLITGNTVDFIMDEFEYTRILTPRNYWDNFKP